MTSDPRTKPSRETRAEESRDARVRAGADEIDEIDESDYPARDPDLDPEVVENYEEMTERGADQRGEGRIP